MRRYLKDLCPFQRGRVIRLDCPAPIRRRLQDLGLIEGTEVECVGIAPPGDPAAYLIRGAVIALRGKDTERIMVEVI